MRSERRRHPVHPVVLAIGGLIVAAALIAGCAIPVKELPIVYVPQENVQPTKGAAAVPVDVKVEDLQPNETINPATDEKSFRVKDAAKTIKDAVETELKARGFKIGSGGTFVTIQLVRFEVTYEQLGTLTNRVRAVLWMRVEVRPQTGKVLYSENVGGEAAPMIITFMAMAPGALPATDELEQSLTDAVKRLFAAPAFTAAILATRQPPPAKPVVSPGRSAGAFAIMSRR